MQNLDAIIVFRIMFILIRVFRELDRYGLARVIINYAYSSHGMKIHAGRPKYILPQEQLEFLVERRFSVPQISKLLGVSPRTVERRLSDHSLSIRQTYTDMNDSDVDGLVRCILQEFRNAGYKRMTCFLLARGIRLQQSRIRSAMQRVNPKGCLLRSLELNVLHRRGYQVYGPLELWHLDANHKLIR